MSLKFRTWTGFTIIILVCCIDYMYLTEGTGAIALADKFRKLGHIGILLCIIPAGYWAWYKHPMQWLRKVWLTSYVVCLVVTVGVGAICYAVGYHDKALLKKIGDIRLFFCSPVPFFMLYVLVLVTKNLPEIAKK